MRSRRRARRVRRLGVLATVAVLAGAAGCGLTDGSADGSTGGSATSVTAPSTGPAGSPAASADASGGGAAGVSSADGRGPAVTWTCDPTCRRWRRVLDGLDRHRARAYAQARPALLRRSYVPGSPVHRADLRMLERWLQRGATIEGVRLRVLQVEQLAPVRRGMVRLRVVDRLGSATAHLADGRERALPRDRPSEHVVVLHRAGNGWRIAASR